MTVFRPFVAASKRPSCFLAFAGVLAIVSLLPLETLSAQPPNWGNQRRRSGRIASRDSSAMMRLVRPLSEKVERSIVQVFSGGRVVSLGTVVSEDGFVLTKHSELSVAPISVRLPDGDKVAASISAVRKSSDLALLKIEGGEPSSWRIQPARFITPEPTTGAFVVSPGRDGFTIGLGVLGVRSRQIGHAGRLGVRLSDDPVPGNVEQVEPSSGAEQAGVLANDRILKINGAQTIGSRAAISTLGGLYPGEFVRLTIDRGGDTIEIDAQMSDLTVLKETQNDAKVNGPRNVRLSGFESVMQHDTVLSPNQCGGPLLDSSGRVIGLNIARAGRVISYALPSELINAEMISMLEEARRR